METRKIPKYLNILFSPVCTVLASIGARIDPEGILPKEILIFSEAADPPALLSEILVAGEDLRFHFHCGVDVYACLRAIRALVLYHRLEGASTIEQQLVRTITADYRLCLLRKVREMCLAAYICRELSKDTIARAYLNSAYFGHHATGYHDASAVIFGTRATSTEECALLIAALKVPISLSEGPSRISRRARRQQRVLSVWRSTNSGGFSEPEGETIIAPE